jgi:hypothetical protein
MADDGPLWIPFLRGYPETPRAEGPAVPPARGNAAGAWDGEAPWPSAQRANHSAGLSGSRRSTRLCRYPSSIDTLVPYMSHSVKSSFRTFLENGAAGGGEITLRLPRAVIAAYPDWSHGRSGLKSAILLNAPQPTTEIRVGDASGRSDSPHAGGPRLGWFRGMLQAIRVVETNGTLCRLWKARRRVAPMRATGSS